MITTPPVVDSCTEQYQHPKPMPTPALTPDQNANPYAPSAQDLEKIKITIDTLERVKRSTTMISDKDQIDKIINQLNLDLLYFKLKHGK